MREVEFLWFLPREDELPEGVGVTFRATVVEDYDTFYKDILSQPVFFGV